jgi:hypothetical protein
MMLVVPSLWAQGFSTPNYAATGVCSVNMAAAGIYTMGGAQEFGQRLGAHKMFVLFGVAEDRQQPDQGRGKIKAVARGWSASINPYGLQCCGR